MHVYMFFNAIYIYIYIYTHINMCVCVCIYPSSLYKQDTIQGQFLNKVL